jgi:hypothetical protein
VWRVTLNHFMSIGVRNEPQHLRGLGCFCWGSPVQQSTALHFQGKAQPDKAAVVLAGVAGDVESFYVGWGEERTPTFTGIGLFLLGFTSSPQPTALLRPC